MRPRGNKKHKCGERKQKLPWPVRKHNWHLLAPGRKRPAPRLS